MVKTADACPPVFCDAPEIRSELGAIGKNKLNGSLSGLLRILIRSRDANRAILQFGQRLVEVLQHHNCEITLQKGAVATTCSDKRTYVLVNSDCGQVQFIAESGWPVLRVPHISGVSMEPLMYTHFRAARIAGSIALLACLWPSNRRVGPYELPVAWAIADSNCTGLPHRRTGIVCSPVRSRAESRKLRLHGCQAC